MKQQDDLTSVEIYERKRAGKILLIIFFLLALAFALLFWKFVPNAPVDYVSITDHFKYGSIGSETANGIPYWIWKVLPDMFPDKLPVPGKGYEGFGLIQEPGRDTPIGFSVRRVYIDRVGLNCAVCHTGTVRDTPQSEPRIILGMPANNFDLQELCSLSLPAAADERFTADNVLLAIERRKRLNVLDRLIYRQAVPMVREALIEQARRVSFMNSRPDWGPGRVDTFNPYKALQFNFPMDLDRTIGTVDLPVIWNQRPREGMQLHWDGNNTSVVERNKSAALGAGVTPVTIDIARMKRIEDWLWDFPAPKYPYAINEQLAAQGEGLYQQHCASCHAFGGAANRKGRAHRTNRHRPSAPRFVHLRTARKSEHSCTRVIRGASRISAKPKDTQTCRSTEFGCARHFFTTAPCRRYAICWSRRTNDLPFSTAATMSSIKSNLVLSLIFPRRPGSSSSNTKLHCRETAMRDMSMARTFRRLRRTPLLNT